MARIELEDALTGEPVLYDPETDTLLVELRPSPAASPAELNEQVGGEDAEERLVVRYGPDGLPHACEIEHAWSAPTWSLIPTVAWTSQRTGYVPKVNAWSTLRRDRSCSGLFLERPATEELGRSPWRSASP